MCPTRITPRRELNSVWLTEARNDHELPQVRQRAVVLATGPMLQGPGVWLSSLDVALLPVPLGGKRSGVALSDGGRVKGGAATSSGSNLSNGYAGRSRSRWGPGSPS
jgi:hypothetical protein